MDSRVQFRSQQKLRGGPAREVEDLPRTIDGLRHAGSMKQVHSEHAPAAATSRRVCLDLIRSIHDAVRLGLAVEVPRQKQFRKNMWDVPDL